MYKMKEIQFGHIANGNTIMMMDDDECIPTLCIKTCAIAISLVKIIDDRRPRGRYLLRYRVL